ncbi:glycosyltransferase family 39 protein [Candidatus Dojkabacteria bacterium]|uniref:Glycosyltransferase family 39 protein n=1 Tax=Candidatus Dojkabacteria bacterium TaxID=2099670 RepID=A0A955L706_9BACT|nr:glycosyltransferase family 39 protein [Candidatus Dojkabacteria bacterium]
MKTLYFLAKIHWTFILIMLCACLLLFWKLDEAPIVRWDEYTNVRVVEDTLSSSNYFLLQYHDAPTGFFFEKPPVFYWLGIFITSIIKSIEPLIALRLVSALSGLAIVCCTYFWVHSHSNKTTATISALVILATPHLFISNPGEIFSTHTFRSADIDALHLLFIVCALIFFEQGIKRISTRWIIGGAVLTSCAVLSKGPFGVLPYALYVSFISIQILFKDHTKSVLRTHIRHMISSGATILALVGAWHIVMIGKFGSEFINEYFFYHIVSRTSASLEGHNGYPTLYLDLLLNYSVFFSGHILVLSIITFVWSKRSTLFTSFFTFVPLFGFILSLTTISFVQTKIAWYLLYCYPFAAILIGTATSTMNGTNTSGWKKVFEFTTIGISLFQIGNILRHILYL